MIKYILIATLLLSTACSGTTANSETTSAGEVARMRIELEQYRQASAAGETNGAPQSVAPTPAPIAPSAAVAAPVATQQLTYRVQTRPVASIHGAIRGCARLFSLRIINDTEYHFQAQLNGQGLAVMGGYGELPAIPPGTTAYVCLPSLGRHTISITASVLQAGRLQQVYKYHRGIQINGQPRGANPTHRLRVNDLELRKHLVR